MTEPSLKTCVQTTQIPVVGKIESCTAGTGKDVGPCVATDTLRLVRELSITLPLPKDGLVSARDAGGVICHRFSR
eukprot:5342333-Lingulodinium_polyedra.AAC.1